MNSWLRILFICVLFLCNCDDNYIYKKVNKNKFDDHLKEYVHKNSGANIYKFCKDYEPPLNDMCYRY